MKVFKFLAAVAALALVACGPDTEEPNNGDGNKEGLKVNASALVIGADGEDAVQFTATYNGADLLPSDLTAYVNGEVTEMPELKFSTTTAGIYTIYFMYNEEKSQEFTIEAVSVGGLDLSPNDEEGLTVRATTTVFQKDVDEVLLIVRYKGEVYDPAKVTFYDFDTNEEIVLESKEVTDINGGLYTLAIYAPEEIGTRTLYAARNSGPGDSRDKPLTLTAVDFAIPSRAIDPKPESTAFNKRTFITQFTGTGCGYCPFVIAALHTLANDAEYGDKFVLAAVHTYSTTDPMYPTDYANISNAFGVSNYPTVIVDMKESMGNAGYENNMRALRNQINKSLEEPAKASVSAKIDYADGLLVARATVKAGEAGDYRVGAWLVEDDIEEMQYNNGCKVEGINFNIHEAALRIPDSVAPESGNYAGYPLGKLDAGQTADHVFVMELKQDLENTDNPKKHWKSENCRLVFFVSVDTGNGYYITNVIDNENLTQTITFDYQ